jgi:hypothetical protein
MKTKSSTILETSETVMINSKLGNVDLLAHLSREERKKEASKPLYLIRYE